MTNNRHPRLLMLVSPLALLIVWEIAARTGLLDVRLFPAPSSVLGVLGDMFISGEIWGHLSRSVYRILAGFLIGAMPGVLLGMVMGLSRWANALLMPLVSSLYPVPKSAIMPLLLVIFGLGEASKVAMIAIGVFFLVIINTVTGVQTIPRIYFDVATTMGAGRWRVIWTVALPGALPQISTGLKLGLGLGLILIVVAEFVGTQTGIGYLIWNSWQMFTVQRMYAGLLVIALLGWLFSLILDELERLLVPWQSH